MSPGDLLGRRRLAAATILAAAVFGYAMTRPLAWLYGVVPDDAFYYLTIARNLARGLAPSIDGGNATNGYHPAWMVVVVLGAKLFPAPASLLRFCLGAAFACHLGTTLCLIKSVTAWTSRRCGLAAGALWAVNPVPIALALQAMEASLYVLALSVAFLVYSTRVAPHLDSPRGRVPAREWVLFGGCLGLCFLGRTEAIVLVAVIVGALALVQRGSSRTRALFVTGGAFALGVLPWFLYAHWTTGSWFQHSGAMKMLWASKDNADSGMVHRISQARGYLLAEWITYPILGLTQAFWRAREVVNAAVTVWLVWSLWRGRANRATRHLAAVGGVLLVGTLGTGLIYGFFFADRQFWYKAEPSFVLFVLLFFAAASATSRAWPGRELLVLDGALVASSIALVASLFMRDPYPWQRDVVSSQKEFDALVPEGEPIGCFNAGLPSYVSSHPIVNLDGLVNNAVYEYYKRGEFDAYLRDAKIRYVADETWSLRRAMRFSRRPVSFEPMVSAPLTGWSEPPRYLWRVAPAPYPSGADRGPAP